MEKLVAIFSVLLIASLFSHPSQAEEREIKSTGGASLGKWKYKEIDPADALLEVELDGRELVKVRAGYIGNSTYREVWNFKRQYFVEKKLSPGRITFVKQIEKSWIGYAKLPSGHHYNGGTFNEKDAPRMIFARTAIKNVDILKTEKRSRNLLIVTYRLQRTEEKCVGLVYVDEEIYGEGYGGSYGDYSARSIACVSKGGDHEQALALSAHYLSLVKKTVVVLPISSVMIFPSQKSFQRLDPDRGPKTARLAKRLIPRFATWQLDLEMVHGIKAERFGLGLMRREIEG